MFIGKILNDLSVINPFSLWVEDSFEGKLFPVALFKTQVEAESYFFDSYDYEVSARIVNYRTQEIVKEYNNDRAIV
jgi:hypothetical protein